MVITLLTALHKPFRRAISCSPRFFIKDKLYYKKGGFHTCIDEKENILEYMWSSGTVQDSEA